ncbi:MAG: hypothetical protein MK135_05520 [Polyangiaceae bacterium]|nr:hypothetical protein [Polyangiaceae bacterium]
MKTSYLFSLLLLSPCAMSLTGCLTPEFQFGASGAGIGAEGANTPDSTGEGGASASTRDDQLSAENEEQSTSSDSQSSSSAPNEGESTGGGESSGSQSIDPGNEAGDEAVPHCQNREVDKDESDVDCGGLDCDPCRDGRACEIDADCSGGECNQGICSTPSCFDNRQNGDESDVDCGGSCEACQDAEQCFVAADCLSGVCDDRTCLAPACDDRLQNGSETDLDCGGSDCPACEFGDSCLDDSDCSVENGSQGAALCDNGSCTIACAAGFEDCNADGICEDISSDAARCGGCLADDPVSGSGIVCTGAAAGQVNICENSSCSVATECRSAWVKNGPYTNSSRARVSYLGYNWICKQNGASNCRAYAPRLSNPQGDGSNDLWTSQGSCVDP